MQIALQLNSTCSRVEQLQCWQQHVHSEFHPLRNCALALNGHVASDMPTQVCMCTTCVSRLNTSISPDARTKQLHCICTAASVHTKGRNSSLTFVNVH